MKRLSKRSLKKLFSVVLALCMVIINPMAVYAKADVSITVQQLSDLLSGTQEMVENLQELGFSMEDIVDMLALSGKTEEQDLQLLYDMVELDNAIPLALYDYDGNPPASYQEQKQRIQNIYEVASRYYDTNYYEGESKGGEDFGKYLTYLYLSHYVDGPGRAPTANDLPYIISSSDVIAYNTFLSSAKLDALFSGLASLGSACYSGFDYTQTVGNISNINSEVLDKIALLYAASEGEYNMESIVGAFGDVRDAMLSYYKEKYKEGMSEEALRAGSEEYVERQLNALGIYSDYDAEFIARLESIAHSVIWSIVTKSLSVLGVLIAALPLFVYSFTTLTDIASFVNLGYSFSGRLAVRTGIYLDL
ncbi:MAG: hypothetical protein NC094_07290 [Bacteroidales bacterium]|nr:hypothetical protein [Lachnoclostridium sp.]MCM1384427.1 hypothetical protein [Lachnoclostridium sp.]MCM1465207.1 hypothetical protein [Bacteroidales bacterium]